MVVVVVVVVVVMVAVVVVVVVVVVMVMIVEANYDDILFTATTSHVLSPAHQPPGQSTEPLPICVLLRSSARTPTILGESHVGDDRIWREMTVMELC